MMKKIAIIIAYVMAALVTAFSTACKDECDELESICKKCTADSKEECKSTLNTCDILKGPAGKDCCEAVLDEWEEACK